MIGATDPISLPAESSAVDAEGELAIIIGRRGRRISEHRAADHILGCTVSKDVTVRDFQSLSSQWFQGKVWDSTTPLGPWIVPHESVPADARIRTRIDGVLVQDGCVDQMIFSVPRLVALISTFMTLDVGDVILTGTPAGNGHTRVPQEYLVPGQTVEVSIDGVGAVRNVVTAGRR
ncbi:fumarylacetoacetate hydrolase family protein [Rhodococcus fascians]|nr:fumarylacetoacetate hydrolase family protein [Rhodococcus fascians]